MVADVYHTVRQCASCAKDRIDLRKHTTPLTLFPARAPLESVALDLLGPLPKSKRGNTHILVIVDRFSKLCRFLPLRSTTAERVAKAFCNEWVFVYGPPQTLLTDNGPQLTAKLFLETCRLLGIRNVFTSTYHPQTNGQTERINRTLASMLRHYVADDQEGWDQFLPALSYAYNRGVHKSTRTTPFDLVLSRPPTPLGAESVRDWPAIGPSWSKATFLRKLSEAVRSTSERIERAQTRYKRSFDRSVFEANRNLKAGDQAFLDARNTPAEQTLLGRRRTKLDPKMIGPYTVLANDGATVVLDVDGLPERINSDRVRPAPSGMDTLPSEGRREDLPTVSESEMERSTETPQEHGESELAAPIPRRSERLRRRVYSLTPSDALPGGGANSVGDPSPEQEWVIDKLLKRGIDKDGQHWAFVKWFGYPATEGTWEPESSLPPRLVSRLARTHKGSPVELE